MGLPFYWKGMGHPFFCVEFFTPEDTPIDRGLSLKVWSPYLPPKPFNKADSSSQYRQSAAQISGTKTHAIISHQNWRHLWQTSKCRGIQRQKYDLVALITWGPILLNFSALGGRSYFKFSGVVAGVLSYPTQGCPQDFVRPYAKYTFGPSMGEKVKRWCFGGLWGGPSAEN